MDKDSLSTALAVVFVLLRVALSVFLVSFLVVWALNTLFGLEIAYSLKTVTAMAVVLTTLYFLD